MPAKGRIDASGLRIQVVPELLEFGLLRPLIGTPVNVKPGETKVIHEVKPYSKDAVAVIVGLGVTQHPGTTYVYNSDGREMISPVPLGEFHAPIYPKRDLGRWLAVGQKLVIAVKNDDKDAHYYASIVWTFDVNKE